jgi:hypothetical protein
MSEESEKEAPVLSDETEIAESTEGAQIESGIGEKPVEKTEEKVEETKSPLRGKAETATPQKEGEGEGESEGEGEGGFFLIFFLM